MRNLYYPASSTKLCITASVMWTSQMHMRHMWTYAQVCCTQIFFVGIFLYDPYITFQLLYRYRLSWSSFFLNQFPCMCLNINIICFHVSSLLFFDNSIITYNYTTVNRINKSTSDQDEAHTIDCDMIWIIIKNITFKNYVGVSEKAKVSALVGRVLSRAVTVVSGHYWADVDFFF